MGELSQSGVSGSRVYPAIYEMDEHDEAKGFVHPFCSFECMAKSALEGYRAPSGGEDCCLSSDPDATAQCEACFSPLMP